MKEVSSTLIRCVGWIRQHSTFVGLTILVACLYYHPELVLAAPVVVGLVNLDPINTATTKNILPGLADNFEGAARR